MSGVGVVQNVWNMSPSRFPTQLIQAGAKTKGTHDIPSHAVDYKIQYSEMASRAECLGSGGLALLSKPHHDQGLGFHGGQERNKNIVKEPALEIVQSDKEVAGAVGEDIGVGVISRISRKATP